MGPLQRDYPRRIEIELAARDGEGFYALPMSTRHIFEVLALQVLP